MAEMVFKITSEQAQVLRELGAVAAAEARIADEARNTAGSLNRVDSELQKGAVSARQATGEFSGLGSIMERAGRSIVTYIGAWAGIEGVRRIIGAHLSDLQKIRDMQIALADQSVASRRTVEQLAVQLGGSVSEQSLALAQTVATRIAKDAGVPMGTAIGAAFAADINFPGGVAPGGKPGAGVQTATTIAQVARAFALTDESKLKSLGDVMSNLGAQDESGILRTAQLIAAGAKVSRVSSFGEFLDILTRTSPAERAAGTSPEETIARSVQFRAVTPSPELAATAQKQMLDIARNLEVMTALAAQEGTTLPATGPERVNLLRRAVATAQKGGQAAIDELMTTLGGGEGPAAVVAALGTLGTEAYSKAVGELRGTKPDEMRAIVDAAQRTQIAADDRNIVGLQGAQAVGGDQPGIMEMSRLRKRFGPESPEFLRRRQSYGAMSGAMSDEEIMEGLILDAVAARINEAKKAAPGSIGTVLSQFEETKRTQVPVTGASDEMLQRLVDTLTALEENIRQSMGRGDARNKE